MQLLHTIWSAQEKLGQDFKDIWIRVNPNYPVTFRGDLTNKENEEGDSDIVIFKVQVFYVGIL